jgi:hypothetical protein
LSGLSSNWKYSSYFGPLEYLKEENRKPAPGAQCTRRLAVALIGSVSYHSSSNRAVRTHVTTHRDAGCISSGSRKEVIEP